MPNKFGYNFEGEFTLPFRVKKFLRKFAKSAFVKDCQNCEWIRLVCIQCKKLVAASLRMLVGDSLCVLGRLTNWLLEQPCLLSYAEL